MKIVKHRQEMKVNQFQTILTNLEMIRKSSS